MTKKNYNGDCYYGLGGRKFIGNPKQPTVTVCQLEEGEYKSSLYKGDEIVQLKLFPDLKLTAEEIFQSAYIENKVKG